MRFELVGKTKATITDIDIQSLKKGQTEVVPAVALTLKIMLPNARLSMLNATLLPFLYVAASPGANAQATLDGVDVVSDMPALTPAAVAIGPLGWDDEQTGCELIIHLGVTIITLKDGKVRVKKITPKEGGAVEFSVSFYTADVDAEVLGELGVLKSHDLDIELTLPELLQQKLPDDAAPAQDATDIFVDAHAGVDPTDAPVTREDVFPTQPSTVPVTTKRRRGLGTDAEQAERQARELAKDPTMAGSV